MIKTRNDALRELGFEPNSEPSNKQIKKKYHKKALEVHPDKNTSSDANDRFTTLAEAYAFLSRPRAEQERLSNAFFSDSSHSPFTTMNAQDLFANLFNSDFNINFFNSFFDDIENSRTSPPYSIRVTIRSESNYMQYTMQFSDQLSFGKQLGKKITAFTVHEDKNNLLPENGANLIIDELLKKESLISAEFPKRFLSDEQNSILQKKISLNRLKQESKKLRVENREKQSNRHWTIMGAFFGMGVAILTGQPYGFVLFYGVATGYISYNLKKIQNILAGKYYQNKKSIAASPFAEKRALKFGVKAITWRGYFTSFKHWQTYRHPQAFAAGMQHAKKENEELVKFISALP